MKKTLFIILVLLLVSFSAGKDFEVSGNAGAIGFGLNNAWATSLNLRVTGSTPLFNKIVAEAELFFYLSPLKEFNFGDTSTSSYAWNLNLYGLYPFNLKNPKLKPYAALGVGFFSAHISVKSTMLGNWTNTETNFNFGIGCGAKYTLNEKSGIRFDARYIVIMETIGDILRVTVGYYIKLK
ncbi:outer membrane beta-barrel protein [Acidobacteriota bacterium]